MLNVKDNFIRSALSCYDKSSCLELDMDAAVRRLNVLTALRDEQEQVSLLRLETIRDYQGEVGELNAQLKDREAENERLKAVNDKVISDLAEISAWNCRYTEEIKRKDEALAGLLRHHGAAHQPDELIRRRIVAYTDVDGPAAVRRERARLNALLQGRAALKPAPEKG